MTHALCCTPPRCSDPALAARLAIEENPANGAPAATGGRKKRAVGITRNFWAPGRTLRIRFLEGTPLELQQAVFNKGSTWLQYANLTFELVEPGAEAEITIEMKPGGAGINYSWPGTEALLPEAMPTMVLSVTPEDERFELTVLHEFGHLLGALHEHQHPDADIPWDAETLYELYEDMGRQHVHEQFLDKYPRSDVYNTVYDKNSIMHYDIPEDWALNGWSLKRDNRSITEKDKTFMRTVYPPADS